MRVFEESVFHLYAMLAIHFACITHISVPRIHRCTIDPAMLTDRAYYAGMKLKSEFRGREFCKPATAKTRRIPIAGKYQTGQRNRGEDAAE